MKPFKILIVPLLSSFLLAQNIEIGSDVSLDTLTSQHDKKQTLVANGTWIFAIDKQNTKMLNNFFREFGIPKNVSYIMDTTRIPSFLFSMFVMPGIKEYKHQILLSDDEEYNKKFPYKEDYITILHVEDKMVTSIKYVNTKEELKETFK